jgi:hypothetical protein
MSIQHPQQTMQAVNQAVNQVVYQPKLNRKFKQVESIQSVGKLEGGKIIDLTNNHIHMIKFNKSEKPKAPSLLRMDF